MATKEFKNGLKFRGIPVNDTIGLTAEQGYVLSYSRTLLIAAL